MNSTITAELHLDIQVGEGPLLEALPFQNQEYETRARNVRKKMEAADTDVLVSFSPENINYLTGHDTPAYQYLQACVISSEGVPVNLLRSIDASNTLYGSWNRAAAVYADNEDPIQLLATLILHMAGQNRRIGFEKDPFFVGPSRYNRLIGMLQSAGKTIVELSIVEELRLIKSEEEIKKIREAARATEAAMESAVALAAEGVNENEIAGRVWASLTQHGGEFPGLPPFIVSGPRTSLGHATWSGRSLVFGDSLAFEIPGVISRYVSPLFRCGVVGHKSRELEDLEAATISSLELLLENIRPGVRCDELHSMNVRNFADRGYKLAHRSGYSVGVNYAPDWGEGNILSIQSGETRVLEEGMVFHLVPGIYVPGKHVVVISETVVVTKDGCECLTNFPRQIFVAPPLKKAS